MVVSGLVVVAALAAASLAPEPPRSGDSDAMTAAASAWLDSLGPERRAEGAQRFDAPARTDWHFVPRSRPGVTFAEMSDRQRRAARDLLRSALSAQGVFKVEAIMALDGVLRELERGNPIRDPSAYTIAVYGEPGPTEPWGWKVEGHHVSLNFTVAAGRVVSVTPAFLGASPAEVPSGPTAGTRPLALEEDLGRELARSLSAEQRARAVIADQAPADVLLIPGREFKAIGSPTPADTGPGLLVGEMTAEQRSLARRIVEEFARNLRHDLAAWELDRIDAAGFENVRFAWAGQAEKGRGHYYRLVGPTFAIEYDNTQGGANHVHTVWHDRARNFGLDALRDHVRGEHARPPSPRPAPE